MKNRKLIIGSICFIVAILGLIIFVCMRGNESKNVKFQDDEMGEVIAYELYKHGKIESVDDIKEENLEDLEHLNIGYTGYYDTLTDIMLCRNLKELIIGAVDVSDRYHNFKSKDIASPESEEKIIQIQKELNDILQQCENLRELYIWNVENTCDLQSLEFLKYGEGLRSLWLQELSLNDYSPVFYCEELEVLYLNDCNISSLEGLDKLKNLKGLSLCNTDISTADEIIKLSNLKMLRIDNTPLAEDEDEMAKIYATFKDIEISIDGDKNNR